MHCIWQKNLVLLASLLKESGRVNCSCPKGNKHGFLNKNAEGKFRCPSSLKSTIKLDFGQQSQIRYSSNCRHIEKGEDGPRALQFCSGYSSRCGFAREICNVIFQGCPKVFYERSLPLLWLRHRDSRPKFCLALAIWCDVY